MSTPMQTEQRQIYREYVQQALGRYAHAYQLLYRKPPRELRMLDRDWISVNGARMRVTELEFLTQQLELEYERQTTTRHTIVKRLISWLSKH